jgi:hypothetical protein
LFANENFIEASRDFVCIRIETYENKQSEKMVRALLGGAFANTAFCIFDPTGRERLTRSGRSPTMSLAGRRSPREADSSDETVIMQMKQIASRYTPRGADDESILQNFYTFRQALNVASADQRLLVVVDADESERKQAQKTLQQIFAEEEVVGRFHLTFIDRSTDKNWSRSITGRNIRPGIMIIRAGTFGLDGTVMDQLKVSASTDDLKNALLEANKRFGALEDRKNYSQHVSLGRREGVYFKNEIPYGEDRDGDGKIDREQRGRRPR